MKNYWNSRFQNENEIWGKAHSSTAELCLQFFSRYGIKNILVPGSGYGRNAVFFENNGLTIEGIEISEHSVRMARENNMTFPVYLGSVLDMPFSDKIYDGIYCFNLLHLFRQEQRKVFINNCYKQLRDGGIIFFTVFSEEEPSYGKGKKTEDNTFESKAGRPVHYFTDEDLRDHFTQFSVIDSGLIEDPEDHGDEGPHTHIIRYIAAQKKEHHEFDGKKYRQASKHQKEWGSKIISGIAFKGNESVLDLGCGDGVLTKQIADMIPGGRVLGIDSSEGMISAAKELAEGNLSFRVMNIDSIAFKEKFDLIFSNATLHWIKDHRKLLRNCRMALKPGGAIRFNFAGSGNCSNFNNVAQGIMSSEPYKKYFKSFEWPWYMPSIDDYKLLLSETDFRRVQLWEENADRYFADQDEMIRWIDQPSIVPFLKFVDAVDKDRFRNEVIDKMLERTKQPDGRCFETFRRINVYAVTE